MSLVISENRIAQKFHKGDLVYFIYENNKKYGIVAHIEYTINDEHRIWAYWQNWNNKSFEINSNKHQWGSGYMPMTECYLESDKSIIKGWKNIPEFFKI